MDTKSPQSMKQIFLHSVVLLRQIWLRLVPLTAALGVVFLFGNWVIFSLKNPFLLVIYFVFSILGFTTLLYYTAHFHRGESVALTQALWVGVKKLPMTLVLGFLVSVCVLMGYAFLIVPGMIVTVWLSMCLPLMMLENSNLLSVFSQSYALTSIDFWHTAGIVFLPSFMLGLLGLGIIEFFIRFHVNFFYYPWVLSVLISMVSLLYLPWVTALVILQFEALKKRQHCRDVSLESLC